jgi:hypothetical protein
MILVLESAKHSLLIEHKEKLYCDVTLCKALSHGLLLRMTTDKVSKKRLLENAVAGGGGGPVDSFAACLSLCAILVARCPRGIGRSTYREGHSDFTYVFFLSKLQPFDTRSSASHAGMLAFTHRIHDKALRNNPCLDGVAYLACRGEG